jgi:hypothetical protein
MGNRAWDASDPSPLFDTQLEKVNKKLEDAKCPAALLHISYRIYNVIGALLLSSDRLSSNGHSVLRGN